MDRQRILSCRPPSRSRGAVLAVVLIVLVIMMLGAASLMRSVDTSALLSGNLAFKRLSVNTASVGLNAAFDMIKKPDFVSYADSDEGCNAAATDPSCTHRSKWIAMNYSPRLLEADASGVPLIMKGTTPAMDSIFGTRNKSVVEGNTIRFLIERMCTDYGASDEKKCSVSDRVERGGTYRYDKPGTISLPLYRVTVRVDGLRNTQTYAQAIMTTRKR